MNRDRNRDEEHNRNIGSESTRRPDRESYGSSSGRKSSGDLGRTSDVSSERGNTSRDQSRDQSSDQSSESDRY